MGSISRSLTIGRSNNDFVAARFPARQRVEARLPRRSGQGRAVAAAQSAPQPPRQIQRVGLSHVSDHLPALRDVPCLVDVSAAEEGAHQDLRLRLSPTQLSASPIADEAIVLLSGTNAAGESRAFEATTLRTFLQPALHAPAPGHGFFVCTINPDRLPSFIDRFIPNGPQRWAEYVLDAVPPRPLELLQTPNHSAESARNTGLSLSVGVGQGARFHAHGANLFLQVHGRKKWSVFLPHEYAAFCDPTPSPRPTALPQYAAALSQATWDPTLHPDMPVPFEFTTQPGQMLYLPAGAPHATWNLDAYTAALVTVNP